MGVDPLALGQPAATLDEIMLLIQIVAAPRYFRSYARIAGAAADEI
jgi:hypothetical protein